MKRTIRNLTLALAAVLGTLPAAYAQPTVFTLSSAISDSSTTSMIVSSNTGFTAKTTQALIDGEMVDIRAVNGTLITIRRGAAGTAAAPHVSGATGYVGDPKYFISGDRQGGSSCVASNDPVPPVINFRNGRRWNCIGGQWMVDNGVMELPPASCFSAVSGNSTGTNGYTTAGTSLTPVIQAQTSVTGTNTHTYVCNVSIPSYLAGKGAVLTDAVFKYGVQGGALGTQAATLSSGAYNSTTVFSYLAFPAPGTSETASTVAPTRADSGSMAITPSAANANTATTTAGAFYTQLFTPGVPIPIPVGAVDRRQLLVSVTLQNTATTATTTNSPGLTVHYAYIPNESFIAR